jgi:hypothetical protein
MHSNFFKKELQTRPSNSLFQIARGSGATLSECTFPNSVHHSKISRSTTWFHSRKHSDNACFYSTRPGGTRKLPKFNHTVLGGIWDIVSGYLARKGEDLV